MRRVPKLTVVEGAPSWRILLLDMAPTFIGIGIAFLVGYVLSRL